MLPDIAYPPVGIAEHKLLIEEVENKERRFTNPPSKKWAVLQPRRIKRAGKLVKGGSPQ